MSDFQADQGFRKIVEAKLSGSLRVLLTGIAEKDRSQATISSLSEQVRLDYAGRMLVEFLQNANDSMSCPGKVRIVLDPGSVPILYVANDGRRFREQDFLDLCDLALSSKDVNECIGNKGLGFRSVFGGSSSPRVYSGFGEEGDGDGLAFMLSKKTAELVLDLLEAILGGHMPGENGVFRWNGLEIPLFALEDPRWALVAGRLQQDPELVTKLPDLTPVQTYPVPLGTPGPVVKEMFSQGFNSVFELPLDQEGALDLVQEELRLLTPSTLLFLSHVCKVEVEVRGPGGSSWSIEKEVLHGRPGRGPEQCEVRRTQDGQVTDAHRFLLHRFEVRGEALQEAVKTLPKNWHSLRRAPLTLAVELVADGTPCCGYYSIGLPTHVETGSSLWIDGPFVGDISRKQIDFENVALNGLLLDEAARRMPRFLEEILKGTSHAHSLAAVCAIAFGSSVDVPLAERLLPAPSWSGEENFVAEKIGKLRMVRCMPRSADGKWAPPGSVRLHSDEAEGRTLLMLGVQPAASIFALPDREYLANSEQLTLLKEVLKRYSGGQPLEPTDVAEVADQVSKKLLSKGHSEDWLVKHFRELYLDLAALVREDHHSCLEGRKIILGQNGRLLAAGGKQPAPFDVPRKAGDGTLQADLARAMPRAVRRQIEFINPHLVDSGDRATDDRIRRLLKVRTPRLVNEFETAEVVSRALAVASRSQRLGDQERWGILAWAYRLWDASGRVPTRARWQEIPLPTVAGWVSAGECYFSAGWNTEGELLQKALSAYIGSEKLRPFIRSPEEFLAGVAATDAGSQIKQEDLELFLRTVLGVGTSPHPVVISAGGSKTGFTCDGWHGVIHPERGLINVCRLPRAAWEAFEDSVRQFRSDYIVNSGKMRYRISFQATIDGLDQLDLGKSVPFFCLVATHWTRYNELLSCEVARLNPYGAELAKCPAPSTLAVALRTLAWIPAARSSSTEAEYLARPADVVVAEPGRLGIRSDETRPHDLLPHLPLAAAQAAGNPMCRALGLARWESLKLLDALRLLSHFTSSLQTGVRDEHRGIARRLWANLLEKAADLFDRRQSNEATLEFDVIRDVAKEWCQVLVEDPAGGSDFRLSTPSSDDSFTGSAVYVPDDPVLRRQLTGHVPMVIVPQGFSNKVVLALLVMRFGVRHVRPLSSVKLTAHAQQPRLDEVEPTQCPLLRSEFPWLVKALAAVIAFGRPQGMKLGSEKFRATVRKLQSLRVLRVGGLCLRLQNGHSSDMAYPAYVLPEKGILLVDLEQDPGLEGILDALGRLLAMEDLLVHALRRLLPLAQRGLVDSPSEAQLQLLMDKFTMPEDIAALERALAADSDRALERALPALLLLGGGDSPETAANKYRAEVSSSDMDTTIAAAWQVQHPDKPAPENLQELVAVAQSDLPDAEVARLAYLNYGIDIAEWNNMANRVGAAGPVRNPDAEALCNELTTVFRECFERFLHAELASRNQPQLYRESLQAVLGVEVGVPAAAAGTWNPSPMCVLEAVLDRLESGLPQLWSSLVGLLAPRAGETANEWKERVTGACSGNDYGPVEQNDSAWALCEPVWQQVCVVGLLHVQSCGKELRSHSPLFLPDPYEAILDNTERLRLASLLDFDEAHGGGTKAWIMRWWQLAGIEDAIGELPAISSGDLVVAWGLPPDALLLGTELQAALRQERHEDERTVTVANRRLRLDDWDSLREAQAQLDTILPPGFGKELDPASPEALQSAGAAQRQTTGPANGNPPMPVARAHRVTAQDQFVGAFGEAIVAWALRNLSVRVESAWKSGNRSHFVHDGDAGNDGLGYDFEFHKDGIRYRVEVKTSSQKRPGAVLLTANELGAARSMVGKKTVRWQVWLVTNALVAPEIRILGNPFDGGDEPGESVVPLGYQWRFRLEG